jgi:ribonuclease III
MRLRELLDALPEDRRRQALTHASWTHRRADAYGRLAFLGDSVLGLAVTTHLFPRLDSERYGEGRLTKIRAQAVSGAACRDVAERLGVPELLEELAPDGAPMEAVQTERVLSSITEAIIGACYLEHGFEATAEAVVEVFAPEIEDALAHPVDFKSALQEHLAQRGETVAYEVVGQEGPPHQRTFEVAASVGEREVGRGEGRSKKHAEQEAARAALSELGATVEDA